MRFIYPARSIISFLTKFCQKRWNTPRGSVLQRQYNLVSLKALFNQHMIYFFIVQQDYPQYLDEYGKMFIEFPRLSPQAFCRACWYSRKGKSLRPCDDCKAQWIKKKFNYLHTCWHYDYCTAIFHALFWFSAKRKDVICVMLRMNTIAKETYHITRHLDDESVIIQNSKFSLDIY